MPRSLFQSTYKVFYYFAGFAILKIMFNYIKCKLMRVPKVVTRPRYSKKSKKLWENGPLCPPEKYSISYSQDDEEPIFDPRNERYLVKPVKRPKVDGFFTAFPGGLNIDHLTGEVDVNASDTGIRYSIEFTPFRESCVAQTTLVIGGISYLGGIFNIETAPERDKEGNGYIAEPFANGRTREDVPKGRFRIINTKELESAKIIIDPETGWIDLKKSIYNGALGFSKNDNGECGTLPGNGTSKELNIQYEWYDEKNQRLLALTQTNLRLHYYNSRSDIPEDLRIRVEQQNNSMLSFNSFLLPILLSSTFEDISDSIWLKVSSFIATLLSSLFFLNSGAQGSNNPYKPPERICVSSDS